MSMGSACSPALLRARRVKNPHAEIITISHQSIEDLVLTYRASSPTVDEKALVRNPASGTQMPALPGEAMAKLDRHKLVGMARSAAVSATVGRRLANQQFPFRRDTAAAPTEFPARKSTTTSLA
jgi:hypothetical protein